jgi:hypothetical protein
LTKTGLKFCTSDVSGRSEWVIEVEEAMEGFCASEEVNESIIEAVKNARKKFLDLQDKENESKLIKEAAGLDWLIPFDASSSNGDDGDKSCGFLNENLEFIVCICAVVCIIVLYLVVV